MSEQKNVGLTPVNDALDYLLNQAPLISHTEQLPLKKAIGRILAEDQYSLVDQPPADNSAMDGYAIHTRFLAKSGSSTSFPIQQRIAAGDNPQPLETAKAARLFTGAVLPPGADAVVMQEQCEIKEGEVFIPNAVQPWQNIRHQGEEFRKGEKLMEAGCILRPVELGLLAAMGLSEVAVRKPLKVVIFSTGAELEEPGKELRPGKIYNSNRFLLSGLLANLGCEYEDGGIIGDDIHHTREALLDATGKGDLVISSGGVSVGEEDHVKQALESIGQLKLWKLAIKPGKPLAFGAIKKNGHQVPFFGLPGNPAAVLVTFLILVRPFIFTMLGVRQVAPSLISGAANFSRNKPSIRREYLRARLEIGEDGLASITSYPAQGSGMLRSASWANGFAVVEANTTVQKGDMIPFIPYEFL